MRTFASIAGLPVFDVNTGEELGKLEDLYLNRNGQVIGFLIDRPGFLNSDWYVPLQAISGFGQDGFMVKDVTRIRKGKHHLHRTLSLRQGKSRLSGKPLVTAEGENLGLLEDVYFLEELGTIVGYEVTEGLLADIKEGKKVVKSKKPLVIGKDILVIEL